MIDVLKPGMFSQFQDLGRFGFQHLGISVAGAMDALSHRIANTVLGNDENDPTLEITLLGPTLGFNEDAVIAWSGADLSPEIGGIPLNIAEPTRIRAGEILRFGKRVHGARAYLAIRGGFDVTPFLGSASTFTRGGVGGYRGRALVAGDILHARAHSIDLPALPVGCEALTQLLSDADASDPQRPIRVMPGREWDHFDAAARDTLFSTPYRVTPQSDRMGYRLEGALLSRTQKREIMSEAIAFGAMQVPPNGQPIILMADRQTTGGYPKMVQVINADLGVLAQKAPGDSVQFELTDLGTAHAYLLAQTRMFASLRESVWHRFID